MSLCSHATGSLRGHTEAGLMKHLLPATGPLPSCFRGSLWALRTAECFVVSQELAPAAFYIHLRRFASSLRGRCSETSGSLRLQKGSWQEPLPSQLPAGCLCLQGLHRLKEGKITHESPSPLPPAGMGPAPSPPPSRSSLSPTCSASESSSWLSSVISAPLTSVLPETSSPVLQPSVSLFVKGGE